jgi:mediator of RNA polymerase II transcription subunit 13
MFTVSKGGAIVQVLPTALRFWDNLGLSQRAGKKNVTAFSFFEDKENTEKQQKQVKC